MSKQINFLGLDDMYYSKSYTGTEPYQFVKVGNVLYARFENKTPCAIVRSTKDTDNIYTQDWAYGNWADRTTLEYIPINEKRVIED